MKIGKNVKISPRAVFYNAEGNLTIGDNTRIDDFCIISCGGGVTIGRNVHIAAYTALFGGSGIVMEDFSAISSHSAVYSQSDDYSGETLTNPTVGSRFKNVQKGLVTIKRHAIIGHGVTIMPGVTIGEGVSVGAKSFVNKDCESWGLYVGVPAKRVKEKSKNLLKLEKEYANGNWSV